MCPVSQILTSAMVLVKSTAVHPHACSRRLENGYTSEIKPQAQATKPVPF